MERYPSALVGIFCASLALLVGACGSDDDDDGDGGGSASKETVRIGFSHDASDIWSAYDLPTLEGMEFAVEDINAGDGPYQVELVAQNNQNDPKTTVEQTQAMLDDGVNIQVITAGDGRAAAGSLVGETGGLALAGLNTYPTWVDEVGGNGAILEITDNIEGSAAAQYACDENFGTAYTLTSGDHPYTKNIPVYFEDAFSNYCEGQVVGTSSFNIGDTDFSAQVAEIKAANPDVIYSGITIPDIVTLEKQLSQAGVDTQFISSAAAYGDVYPQSAGAAAEGTVVPTYVPPDDPKLAEFQQQFKAQTGKAPLTPFVEAVGADQIYGIVNAADEAGSTDPLEIQAALSDVPPETWLAMREVTIDSETHMPSTAEISITQVENGKYVEVASITPDYIPEPVR